MTLTQRRIAQFLISYLFVFLLYTVVLLSLFQSGLFASSILFYRGIFLSIIAFLTVLFLRAIPRVKVWRSICPEVESWISALIASASLHFCFFVVVPVTIDRSVTTFLLAQMSKQEQTRSGAMTREELGNLFIRDYVNGNDAIGRRMREQIASGNVAEIFRSEAESEYKITERGRAFVSFARLMSKVYRTSDTVLR